MTYISDPAKYIEMMTDDAIEVTDLMYANKEHVVIRWHATGEFLESLPNTNILLTAYIMAQARLKLYTLLEYLQERVLYFDTDSVVYVHDETKWNPELGDYLGELKYIYICKMCDPPRAPINIKINTPGYPIELNHHCDKESRRS